MARWDDWTTEDGLLLLSGWARDGLVESQIAQNMGIALSTLKEWKKKNPAISDALKKGKAVADFHVENALFKRALGYEYTEERLDKSGETVAVLKHVPPDVTACIFWLKNRRREQWSATPEKKEETELKNYRASDELKFIKATSIIEEEEMRIQKELDRLDNNELRTLLELNRKMLGGE